MKKKNWGKTIRGLLGLISLLLVEGKMNAQSIPPDLGLITKMLGGVTYQNDAYQKTPAQARSFMKVRQGDKIKIPQEGTVRIVYFASGREETWKGPVEILVGEKECTALKNTKKNIKPEVKTKPIPASRDIQRIPSLLRKVAASRSGGSFVRGDKSESFDVVLTPEEKTEIEAMKKSYEEMKKTAETGDITPELFILSVFADYEQYGEMSKTIEEALKRSPKNETLKNIDAWLKKEQRK